MVVDVLILFVNLWNGKNHAAVAAAVGIGSIIFGRLQLSCSPVCASENVSENEAIILVFSHLFQDFKSLALYVVSCGICLLLGGCFLVEFLFVMFSENVHVLVMVRCIGYGS